MAQFEIITSQEAGVIKFNFEELKKNLEIAIEPYTSMVITEDKIIEGKKTKAGLNTLKKSINDKKIEIKKVYMQPYEVVEAQMKELMAIIDTGVVNLDGQLKNYEEQKKAEKYELIKQYFNELLFGLVSFDRLFDEKWLNATVTDKQWKGELEAKINDVKSGLQVLENFGVEDKPLLKSLYLETLDMIVAKNRYDSIQASKAKVEAKPTENMAMPESLSKAIVEPENLGAEILTRTFWVKGTLNQIYALGEFMNANRITFGKVE